MIPTPGVASSAAVLLRVHLRGRALAWTDYRPCLYAQLGVKSEAQNPCVWSMFKDLD